MASTIRGDDNFDSNISIVYDKLSSGSFSGTGSVEITLSGSYNVYEVLIRGLRNSATNVLYYHRFKAGSTTYTSGYKSNGNPGQAYGFLGYSDGNAENIGISGRLTILEPHNSSHYVHSYFEGVIADNDRYYSASNFNYGAILEQTANITSVIIDASNTANFTHGNWTLYGVKV